MGALLMARIMVRYFAILREQRGLSEESIEAPEETPALLYERLRADHNFSLPASSLRVAINDEFASMEQDLRDGDSVAFLAPVAGG